MLKKYYEWLTKKVDNYETALRDYQSLLQRMFITNFYWTNNDDYNRAMDGLHLRKVFEEQSNFDCSEVIGHLDGSCSVLEMLIALSERMEAEYMKDHNAGNRSYIWFWMMIDNLDLTKMCNKKYDSAYTDDALFRFLGKTGSPKSKKPPLFLFKYKNPQTQIDISLKKPPIWKQMMAWVTEQIDCDF